MRLLRTEDGGNFSLVEFVGSNIPPYAILSHTWGIDDEEVTFKDIKKGKGKSKAGYSKLRFCGEQAANNGLQFFWVDTCCIDKSSSAELAEAINSMFRWYHDAAICYVYLSDVSVGGSQNMWKPALQRSRWFTRGWTLQELLAPTSVEFYSVEGERIGDKNSLTKEIHDTTQISIQALTGRPLARFGVEERMMWAERRETKREEDAAYSLLGIFDVHMPLIYGEGRKKALNRLQKEIKEASTDEISTSSVNNAYTSEADDVSVINSPSGDSESSGTFGTMTFSDNTASEIPKDEKGEIGWYFVELYYNTLAKSPEKLPLFYKEKSQHVSGFEQLKSVVYIGRSAIENRIKELDFHDCKPRITNVDCQGSDESIVIQVIGEISKIGQPYKRFVQTFVLAKQPMGYYVLNDIFRYLIEDDE